MPRVLVTRAPHQASALAEALFALGCEPILIPTIEFAPPTSFAALDDALPHLDRFHWLIFTSANAVEAFLQRATDLQRTGFSPPQKSCAKEVALVPGGVHTPHFDLEGWLSSHRNLIATIGPATARALEAHGLHADLIPPQAVAESLTAALLPHVLQPDGSPTRMLLIRAESARDHLPDRLRAAGAELTLAPAYRTVIAESSIAELQQLFRDPEHYPDAITFTSSSTVTSLLALLDAAGLTLPPKIIRASIGPITSRTLREAGLPPHIEALEATVDSLAKTLVAYLDR